MRKLVSSIIALVLMTGMLAACAPSNTNGTETNLQTAPPEASTQDTEATEPTDGTEETTEPPHPHSYTSTKVAATCTSKGYTLHKCRCGSSYTSDETAALGHSWGNWTVVTQPTTQQEGKQTRTCSRCGATESQSIPKVEAPALEWSDLDLNRAMAVGNQYAASKYGCIPDNSLGFDGGYDFPISYGRSEIMSYVPAFGSTYQEALEFAVRDNVDAFVVARGYGGADNVQGWHIRCYCEIKDNLLWIYVFY